MAIKLADTTSANFKKMLEGFNNQSHAVDVYAPSTAIASAPSNKLTIA